MSKILPILTDFVTVGMSMNNIFVYMWLNIEHLQHSQVVARRLFVEPRKMSIADTIKKVSLACRKEEEAYPPTQEA